MFTVKNTTPGNLNREDAVQLQSGPAKFQILRGQSCNPEGDDERVFSVFIPRQNPGTDRVRRARKLLLPACGNRHDLQPG